MRIVGGKDYYDGAMPFDTDDSRTFPRNKSTIDPVDFNFDAFGLSTISEYIFGYGHRNEEMRLKNDKRASIKNIYVLFAGKIYCGVHVRSYDDSKFVTGLRYSDHYFWHSHEMKKFMNENDLKFREPSRYRWKEYQDGEESERLTLDYWFATRDLKPDLLKYVLDNKILVGIITLESGKWVWKVNTDGLKFIKFASRIPPHEAYQELDMFMGTILVSDQDNMVKISDKSMIAKHGFDNWSFKNKIHAGKPRGH